MVKDLTTEEAYKAAERCGLSIVAQVKKACEGDLSKVKSCIKLTGFVNSTEDFIDQPKVINGIRLNSFNIWRSRNAYQSSSKH